MNCPQCQETMYVVCSNPACVCRQRIPAGKLPMVIDREQDTEACPYCGFTEHIDFWSELEMDESASI